LYLSGRPQAKQRASVRKPEILSAFQMPSGYEEDRWYFQLFQDWPRDGCVVGESVIQGDQDALPTAGLSRSRTVLKLRWVHESVPSTQAAHLTRETVAIHCAEANR
jgi:hypothetical protein